MGLSYKKKPADYPEDFVAADEDNLDCEKTLALIEAFAKTHDKPGGVQMIFLDFHVQGILYKWAKAHGADEDHLDWLFQFPHGRGNSDGIVRHDPNHHDHLHVRFHCPLGAAFDLGVLSNSSLGLETQLDWPIGDRWRFGLRAAVASNLTRRGQAVHAVYETFGARARTGRLFLGLDVGRANDPDVWFEY